MIDALRRAWQRGPKPEKHDRSPSAEAASALISLRVTGGMLSTIQQLCLDSGQPLDVVFTRAIGLYWGAVAASLEGKHVGYAASSDDLEVEFVGIGRFDGLKKEGDRGRVGGGDCGSHDKVRGFIHETLLHENLIESVAFDPSSGSVRLNLLQPGRDSRVYPDPELLLTFSGVRDFAAHRSAPSEDRGETISGIDCTIKDGLYRAAIAVGEAGVEVWTIELTFADLRYKCS